jgi:hypothetical protein
MIVIVVAALFGAASTFAALLSYGIVAALLGAPLGGSLAALVAGILIATSRTSAKRSPATGNWAPSADTPLLTRRI